MKQKTWQKPNICSCLEAFAEATFTERLVLRLFSRTFPQLLPLLGFSSKFMQTPYELCCVQKVIVWCCKLMPVSSMYSLCSKICRDCPAGSCWDSWVKPPGTQMGTSEMMTLTVWQMSQEHIPQRLSTSKTGSKTHCLDGRIVRHARLKQLSLCLAGNSSINSCSLTAVQLLMVLLC